MEITEVRVKLKDGGRREKLKAFCSITFDNDFVIRDLKIIEGTNGYFVAMPSRKLTDHCPSCRGKNHLRAHYCNDCGKELPEKRTPVNDSQVPKLHADIAHPVNSQTRQIIQKSVVEAYHEELQRAKDPDYRPPDMGDMDYETRKTHMSPPSDNQSSKEQPPPEANENGGDHFSKGILS